MIEWSSTQCLKACGAVCGTQLLAGSPLQQSNPVSRRVASAELAAVMFQASETLRYFTSGSLCKLSWIGHGIGQQVKGRAEERQPERKAGAMQAVADNVLPLDDSGTDKGKTDGL